MAKKKLKHIHVPRSDIFTALCGDLEDVTFNGPCILFYEGHTPTVAILLVEGEIELKKRSKHFSTMPVGSVLGLTELFEHQPVKFEAHVSGSAKIKILDRSSLKTHLKNSSSSVSSYLLQQFRPLLEQESRL